MYQQEDLDDMIANLGDMAIDGQLDVVGVYVHATEIAQEVPWPLTVDEVLRKVRKNLERREHLYDEVTPFLDKLNRLIGDGRGRHEPVMHGATAPAA